MSNTQSKKSYQLSIRMTEELRQKLEEEAALQRRKKSDLATIILEQYFESKENLKKIAEKR